LSAVVVAVVVAVGLILIRQRLCRDGASQAQAVGRVASSVEQSSLWLMIPGLSRSAMAAVAEQEHQPAVALGLLAGQQPSGH
jgi:hypothetical protein